MSELDCTLVLRAESVDCDFQLDFFHAGE